MKQIRLQIFAGFCILTLLVVFLDRQGLLSPVRSGMQIISSPVQFAAFSVKNGLLDSVSFLTFWKSGEARIKNLELRNLELVSEAGRLKAVERENAELKKQLKVDFLSEKKRLPAGVLGVARYMTLSRGKNDGVRIGQSVVYLDNFVGKIVRVDNDVSFVQLPTDVDLKIPVKVGAAGEISGVAYGQFNSAIVLDQVSQDEQIGNGEFVLTSGDEGKFIPDLILGKIERIFSRHTDLFQRAEVKPLVVYDRLQTVFVITE